MDICPSCGAELTGRTLQESSPAEPPEVGRRTRRELRRCGSCRHLAWRAEGARHASQPWSDGGVDPDYDSLFDFTLEPLPAPWFLVPAHPGRATLEAELRAEVSEGHPLHGKPVIAVARCERCDEVLFSVEEDPVRFVRVHLTWKQGPDTPPWPMTEPVPLPLYKGLTEHTHEHS
ncbi:hypothetical protein [Streptomyces sp. NPDC048172]|uniref:hypothetical protein n=1 Tax=Streptomyces sp. NPDC048172 TaxID=3365505 RepID=UPI0037127C00